MAGTFETIVGMMAQSYAQAWRALPHEPALASGYLLLNAISVVAILSLLALTVALPVIGFMSVGGQSVMAGFTLAGMSLVMVGAFVPALLYTRAAFVDLVPEDTKSKC